MRSHAARLVGLGCCLIGGFGCGSAASVQPAAGSAGAPSGGAQSGAAGHGGSGVTNQAGTATGGGAGGAGTGGAGASNGGGGGGGGDATAGGGSAGSGALTGKPLIFVGGFGANYPVRAYDVDKTTGALTQRGPDFDAGPDPSYLTLNLARTHLYAANENDGQQGGVTALSIQADGSLQKLNHQTGSDKGFTHLAVAPSGKLLLAASYNGGSVSVFPLGADGSLGAELGSFDLGASSQAHCVSFDHTGKYVLVATKGADRLEQLVLAADGSLTANTPPSVSAASGAGPRHIAVHPGGELVFVVNELNSTLTPYRLSVDGKLSAGTSVSTLPSTFTGRNSGAHVEVSPDGRFVYASNRGHDSIAAFSADQVTGALTLIEHESTRGNTPRDFDVDPNGDVLVVANQDSATLSVFKIEASGGLSPLGTPTPSAPMPSAVQFHYLP